MENIKYNTIIKCDLVDYRTNKKECTTYLLTYKGCDNELEIDLIGELFFNEYKTTKRKIIQKVSNIKDLIQFLDNNKINIREEEKKDIFDLKNKCINVGGSRDYVLNYDLSFKELKEF